MTGQSTDTIWVEGMEGRQFPGLDGGAMNDLTVDVEIPRIWQCHCNQRIGEKSQQYGERVHSSHLLGGGWWVTGDFS